MLPLELVALFYKTSVLLEKFSKCIASQFSFWTGVYMCETKRRIIIYNIQVFQYHDVSLSIGMPIVLVHFMYGEAIF